MIQLSKSASIYKREYEKIYPRKLWINSHTNSKFSSLDKKLQKVEIDPEDYVMYCIRKWIRFSEFKSINSKMIKIDRLCSDELIGDYISSNPLSDKTYVYSVLMNIENVIAIGTIRAYLEVEENNGNINEYLESIEQWKEDEFQVCYDGSCDSYEEAKHKYHGMYAKVIERTAISICSQYGIRFEFPDYEHIYKQIIEKRRNSRN